MRFAALAMAVVLLCSIAPHGPRIAAPRLVLWAWERPEDLRFIDPSHTGVAYLAATVELDAGGRAQFRFRRQPLRVPAKTALIAVVRIESPRRYVFPDPAEIVAGIASAARQPGVAGLQIDYDARASERPFYRSLLAELRRRTDLPIGITALASWCSGDAWLAGEPVAEAVPMFFRMGRGESREMPVDSEGCRSAIGLSTDEPWPERRPPGLRASSRIYVFNPKPWTEAEYSAVVRKSEEWR